MKRIKKNDYIIDENDPLSEGNMISLGQNRTNGAVFHNTFDYNHYVYSDYLVCTVAASAHIIRWWVFVKLL